MNVFEKNDDQESHTVGKCSFSGVRLGKVSTIKGGQLWRLGIVRVPLLAQTPTAAVLLE